MKELDCGLDELIQKVYKTVLEEGEWGEASGGRGKMEWYGTCGDYSPNPKRKRGAM